MKKKKWFWPYRSTDLRKMYAIVIIWFALIITSVSFSGCSENSSQFMEVPDEASSGKEQLPTLEQNYLYKQSSGSQFRQDRKYSFEDRERAFEEDEDNLEAIPESVKKSNEPITD